MQSNRAQNIEKKEGNAGVISEEHTAGRVGNARSGSSRVMQGSTLREFVSVGAVKRFYYCLGILVSLFNSFITFLFLFISIHLLSFLFMLFPCQ